MILIDLNQVMISNLMAQSRGDLSELPSKDAVRHSILNTIRAFNVKFSEEFGEVVLCADAADPWRRDIFPNYKHQRRKGRVESKIDWDGLFKIMSEIREEFSTKLPYKLMHVEKCVAIISSASHFSTCMSLYGSFVENSSLISLIILNKPSQSILLSTLPLRLWCL